MEVKTEETEDGLNRTFMELKHLMLSSLSCVKSCLNRTFMELKQMSALMDSASLEVLIEPLWN